MDKALNTSKENKSVQEQVTNWFEELISNIHLDKILMETQTAPIAKTAIYNKLISGNEKDIMVLGRQMTSMRFIQYIITDYIQDLASKKKFPPKLAFNFSDPKILIWAEIADDDEETENALILAEAKINSEYSKYGFHVSTSILEASDKAPIPSQYNLVKQ